jgi:hypothetical protein
MKKIVPYFTPIIVEIKQMQQQIGLLYTSINQ